MHFHVKMLNRKSKELWNIIGLKNNIFIPYDDYFTVKERPGLCQKQVKNKRLLYLVFSPQPFEYSHGQLVVSHYSIYYNVLVKLKMLLKLSIHLISTQNWAKSTVVII